MTPMTSMRLLELPYQAECDNQEVARGHLEEVRGEVFEEQVAGW